VVSSKVFVPDEDKKAIPELLFKQYIVIVLLPRLINSLVRVERNSRVNRGVVNFNDKCDYESNIIGLFVVIKPMIMCQKKFVSMSFDERSRYVDLNRLLSGSNFELNRLKQLHSFLSNKLHELNLTNLLIDDSHPFKDFEDFG
jgi:hypothetical protein